MPAVSAKQRMAMAIAEHNPAKLHSANKGMLDMSQKQLHDFASTKGLQGPFVPRVSPSVPNIKLRKGQQFGGKPYAS